MKRTLKFKRQQQEKQKENQWRKDLNLVMRQGKQVENIVHRYAASGQYAFFLCPNVFQHSSIAQAKKKERKTKEKKNKIAIIIMLQFRMKMKTATNTYKLLNVNPCNKRKTKDKK